MLEGVIFGALVSVVLVVFVEKLRQPKIKIELIGPTDKTLRDGRDARWLHVKVVNEPLLWATWLQRNPAISCRASIQFRYFDGGHDVFGESMAGRWSDTPEPLAAKISIGDQTYKIEDPQRSAQLTMDIPPGESERLDPAARFAEDENAWGWNNDS